MKKTIFLLLTAVFFALGMNAQSRKTICMDKDWRFSLGENPGATDPSFDDSSWRTLDVPHDWSIEGKYNKYNKTGRGGGYLPSGDGWYRKSFSLPDSDKGKKVYIEFDGVMANSEVYINGQLLGKRPYGYSSFLYNMTDFIQFGDGQKNVLAVRANNTDQPSSRWYTGAGIYRHVRMMVKDPVHLGTHGTFIRTPEVSASKALVKATLQVNNVSDAPRTVTVQSAIIDKNGKTVKTATSTVTVPVNTQQDVEQQFTVSKPMLWSVDSPAMYTLEYKILDGKKELDRQSTPFGIRSIRYDAAKGFFLNDKPLKMYGVCMHHDGSAVGAAVPLGVWEYRLNKLKEAGANAIRTSHNPVAPEFLDLCDRMGFLVMNENFDTWEVAKNPYDYHLYFKEWWEKDTRDMVLRDRNHPCVVIYSVGNEIHDKLNTPEGFKKYKDQQDLIHKLDGTRPVTMALFRPNVSGVYANGFADMMDVVGQNYRPNELLDAHTQNPKRIVMGTENVHDVVTWQALRDNEFMCGQFLWTGFEYLGEAGWPKIGFEQGLFDKAGGWKREGLQRRTWWTNEPSVYVVRRSENAGVGPWMHDWTPNDFVAYDEAYIEVYSNADEVELFLNGESLGTKQMPKDASPVKMIVTYKKGELRAEARTAGKVVATEVLKTAGAPAEIVLSAHKAKLTNHWDDLCYVKATVVDADGVRCPDADHLIQFKAEGAGKVIATDSGDLMSHESYTAPERSAFRGECFALVRADKDNGTIKITARAEGITGVSEIEIPVAE